MTSLTSRMILLAAMLAAVLPIPGERAESPVDPSIRNPKRRGGLRCGHGARRGLPQQTNQGGRDVRKYDVLGNEQWTRQFGTSAVDSPRGVAADASGVESDQSTDSSGYADGRGYPGGADHREEAE
jgi:hypothetical protein